MFSALAGALIAAILLGQQHWCIIPLLILLARVLYLREPRAMLLVLTILSLVTVHSWLILHSAKELTVTGEQRIERKYLVQPDAIQLNGNLVTAVATNSDGEVNLLYLRLANPGQVIQWQRVTNPVIVKVNGQKQPIMPATNENQFDGQKYYRAKGIFNCVRGTGAISSFRKPRGSSRLHHWRAVSRNYLQSFPTPLNLFCERLILGFNDVQLSDTMKQVQQLGVIHLFCLSGLHVTVLCGLIRKILSYLNVTRERINHFLVIVLPVFWVIGGESVSLSRAVLMLELTLFCKVFRRPHCDFWSLGLMIHEIIDPSVLLNLGGQLSYLLSFALCHVQWSHNWRQAVDLNFVSIPVLLNQTFQIHCLTMLFNYIMIPVFSWVILPGIILCIGFGKLCPELLLIVNQLLIDYQHLLSWLAHCPGSLILGKLPNGVTLFLVITSLLYIEHCVPGRPLLVAIVGIYSMVFVCLHFPLSGEVVFFDVGQGDSILIREPLNHRVVMIDTGGQLHFKQPDWQRRKIVNDGAQRISVNYLKSKGVHSIDAIFLSHSDADHIGYITTLTSELRVKKVVVPAGMEKLAKFTKRIPVNTKVEAVTDQSNVEDGFLQILHPFKAGKGTNADSMVLWGKFGNHSFIFTGDLDRSGERAVVKKYPALRADVIKLGHHGSKTASDPRFLAHLHPQYAIISAGRRNRYGHPNQETLTSLHRQAIPYFSTQKQGMIKYSYTRKWGSFHTILKGDEFAWMQSHLSSN